MWEGVTMKYKLYCGDSLMKKVREIEWIWEPLIPRNCISILASRGGVGKSAFALWLADLLTGQGKKVLYMDAERCGFHIKQRVLEWNLQNWKEIIFTGCEQEDGSAQTGAPSTTTEIHTLIKECSPDLVILDSLTMFARGFDSNRREAVAIYLEELTKIASECNTGILLLAHTKKRQIGDDTITLDSIAGSGAITDLARSVMLMDFDYAEEGRIITQLKINLSAKSKPLTFKITSSGITDMKFLGEIERESGTKADMLRAIALKSLQEGAGKKEVRLELKKAGAFTTEYARAIDWASEKLGIKWNGDLKDELNDRQS
jgi:predicted ATP-dependent serine protease